MEGCIWRWEISEEVVVIICRDEVIGRKREGEELSVVF